MQFSYLTLYFSNDILKHRSPCKNAVRLSDWIEISFFPSSFIFGVGVWEAFYRFDFAWVNWRYIGIFSVIHEMDYFHILTSGWKKNWGAVILNIFLGRNQIENTYVLRLSHLQWKTQMYKLKLEKLNIITKEEPSLKVIFYAMAVCKTQSKCQTTAFLLVTIQICIDFYALTWQKSWLLELVLL